MKSKMNILYLGKKLDNTYAASWYYMIKWLSNNQIVYHYGPDLQLRPRYISFMNFNRIGKYVNRMSSLFSNLFYKKQQYLKFNIVKLAQKTNPDVILLDSFFPPNPEWMNLHLVKLPKAMVISDPHFMLNEKLKYAEKNLVDLIFFDYRFAMKLPAVIEWRERNPEILVYWLPHSVDTNVFRDYGFQRRFDVISSGSRDATIYPMRNRIYSNLSKNPDIHFSMPLHARYFMNTTDNNRKMLIRENYAKFLSSAKIFIFGSSIFNYPLMKYTEGMACNTLVLAPKPRDASYLHFIPGENFIEIDAMNFIDMVKYYLQEEDERIRISKNGFDTVRKYHSVKIRGLELVRQLKRIITS